jgi:hypothetical protein
LAKVFEFRGSVRTMVIYNQNPRSTFSNSLFGGIIIIGSLNQLLKAGRMIKLRFNGYWTSIIPPKSELLRDWQRYSNSGVP